MDAHGLVPAEKVSASKKLGRDEARSMELDDETQKFWTDVRDFFDAHVTEEVHEEERRTGGGFNEALQEWADATAAAIAAAPATLEDAKATVGPVFQTCKGCHDDYRIEDE